MFKNPSTYHRIFFRFAVMLGLLHFYQLALAENWTYVHTVEKSFYQAVDTDQPEVLLNRTVPIDDVLRPGQSLKVSIVVPAGVGLLNVSAQGVFDGQPGGRPLVAHFDYDPVTICVSNPESCPSNSAPLLSPPFGATNASLSENVYEGTALSVEEANAAGGTVVALAIYHGASAPRDFTLFGPLAINIGVSNPDAYNAWVNNTTQQVRYQLTVASEGFGNVVSNPVGINCGNNFNACVTEFSQNEAVTLTATPAQGSIFRQWGGDCTGTLAQTTVAMSRSKGCTAIFASASIAELEVSVNGDGFVTSSPAGINCGNGNVDCSTTSLVGDLITLTATSNSEGVVFESWTGVGCESNERIIPVTLNTNRQCKATFTSASAGASGIDLFTFSLQHPVRTDGSAGVANIQVSARLDEYEETPYFLTQQDFAGQVFPLEDSILTLNTTITPDASLGEDSLDIILLALWEDQQRQQIWMVKTAPQGSFDFNDSSVWSKVDLVDALSNGFAAYRANLSASRGFSTSFGSGRVVAPFELGNEGRTVAFYPAYQSNTTGLGAARFFVAGAEVRLGLPDSVLKSEYTVPVGSTVAIQTSTSNAEFIATDGCEFATTQSVATAAFEQSIDNSSGSPSVVHICNVSGVEVGETRLSVTTNTGKTLSTLIRVVSN